MTGFTTADSREVYRGRVRVRVDDVVTPDGETVVREIVEAIPSVVVVALSGDEVLLVEQHRQATGGVLLELPAGVRDVEGESAVEVGARELAEETGHGAHEWRELGTFWSSPGWTDERFTVVLGTGGPPVPRPAGFEADGEERHLRVVTMPLDEAVAAVHDGRIVDASSAFGLLLARAGS